MKNEKKDKLIQELRALLNRLSIENESDTPDFVLSVYLFDCLNAFKKATRKRDQFYGDKRWQEVK